MRNRGEPRSPKIAAALGKGSLAFNLFSALCRGCARSCRDGRAGCSRSERRADGPIHPPQARFRPWRIPDICLRMASGLRRRSIAAGLDDRSTGSGQAVPQPYRGRAVSIRFLVEVASRSIQVRLLNANSLDRLQSDLPTGRFATKFLGGVQQHEFASGDRFRVGNLFQAEHQINRDVIVGVFM